MVVENWATGSEIALKAITKTGLHNNIVLNVDNPAILEKIALLKLHDKNQFPLQLVVLNLPLSSRTKGHGNTPHSFIAKNDWHVG